MKRLAIFCAVFLMAVKCAKAVDYKAYFDREMAVHLQAFSPPEIGEEYVLTLRSGIRVRGVLERFDEQSITLRNSGERRSYAREVFDKQSRSLLFAEDYATQLAIKETRKFRLHIETQERLERGAELIVDLAVEGRVEEDLDRDVKLGEEGEVVRSTLKSIRDQHYLLDITLTNRSRFDTILSLRWYFVSRRYAGEEDPAVLIDHWGGRWISVKRNSSVQQEAESPEIRRVEMLYAITRSGEGTTEKTTVWGREYIGYIVLVKFEERVLAIDASNALYLETEWLERLPEARGANVEEWLEVRE